MQTTLPEPVRKKDKKNGLIFSYVCYYGKDCRSKSKCNLGVPVQIDIKIPEADLGSGDGRPPPARA